MKRLIKIIVLLLVIILFVGGCGKTTKKLDLSNTISDLELVKTDFDKVFEVFGAPTSEIEITEHDNYTNYGAPYEKRVFGNLIGAPSVFYMDFDPHLEMSYLSITFVSDDNDLSANQLKTVIIEELEKHFEKSEQRDNDPVEAEYYGVRDNMEVKLSKATNGYEIVLIYTEFK